MSNEVLERAADRFVLRLIGAEDLVAIANECLELGADSHSLRMLAAMDVNEPDIARRTFEQVLAEFGVLMPSVRAAVTRLAFDAMEKIASGRLNAYVGAKRIWDFTLCAPNERWPELDPFVYAASEWEDRPEDRKFFEDEVLAEAKRQVSRG